MNNSTNLNWKKRLILLKNELEENNFEVFLVNNAKEAKFVVMNEILLKLEIKSVSRGDSLTFEATGLFDEIKKNPALNIIDPFETNISEEVMYERCREALLVDLFFTGTNAVTESGILVNLDSWGNRIAGLTFGPKNVIVFIGRNKIVSNLDEAMFRIKNYAAPMNAIRFNLKTPCVKTSLCEDCKRTERICNSWTITEKSFPKGRVKIILINDDLGF